MSKLFLVPLSALLSIVLLMMPIANAASQASTLPTSQSTSQTVTQSATQTPNPNATQTPSSAATQASTEAAPEETAPDPCAPPTSRPTAFNSGTFSYLQGSMVPSTPASPPEPENPAVKQCEHGLVRIAIQSDRQFGYRIGEPVTVTILIFVAQSIVVDFTNLLEGDLLFSGRSDLALVGTPTVTQTTNGNWKLYRVEMNVRFSSPEPSHVLVVQARYATGYIEGTQLPNYRLLQTPQFVIGTSFTLDQGHQLLPGLSDAISPRTIWIGDLTANSGFILVVVALFCLSVLHFRRARNSHVVSNEERAWRLMNKTFTESGSYDAQYYSNVAAALRMYFGMEAKSSNEILAELNTRNDVSVIAHIFETCENILYGSTTLDVAAHQKIQAELRRIIHRPW